MSLLHILTPSRSHFHSPSVPFSFSFTFSICPMFAFQDLAVYKKSKQFHMECKKIIQSIPYDKMVVDQLNRASLSIILNIAEGSGKFSNADRKKFFIIARASIFECVAILDILHDENKIDDTVFKNQLVISDQISRILFTMIQNLK